MLPLLLQIFLSLLAAAALGAGLAWFWLKRRYEDVTERFERLEKDAAERPEPLSRSEFEAGLGARFSGLRFPETDLVPVFRRLDEIEAGVQRTSPAMEALQAQVDRLDSRLVAISSGVGELKNADLSPVETGMAGLADNVTGLGATIRDKQWVDLRPLEARMSRLEGAIQSVPVPEIDLGTIEEGLLRIESALAGIDLPEPDLGPLHSGLARLEMMIDGQVVPETDLTPLQSQLDHVMMELSGIEQKLAALAQPETSPLASSVAALSDRMEELATPDLTPLRDRLAVIERLVGNLSANGPDLGPVMAQLDRLEPIHRQLDLIKSQVMAPNQGSDVLAARVAGMMDSLAAVEASVLGLRSQMSHSGGLDSVERRLAGLQEAFLGLRQTDLAPVLGRLRQIEERGDLRPVETRLTNIEYALAGLEKLLRSQNEARVTNAFRPPSRLERSEPSPAPPPEPETSFVPAPREPDPIDEARRPDDRANLLQRAAFGEPDDLEQISGVGPMLNDLLNSVGVYYFWQIAEWTDENVEWVDDQLNHFKGRITRDEWVSQAQLLARQPGAARRPKT